MKRGHCLRCHRLSMKLNWASPCVLYACESRANRVRGHIGIRVAASTGQSPYASTGRSFPWPGQSARTSISSIKSSNANNPLPLSRSTVKSRIRQSVLPVSLDIRRPRPICTVSRDEGLRDSTGIKANDVTYHLYEAVLAPHRVRDDQAVRLRFSTCTVCTHEREVCKSEAMVHTRGRLTPSIKAQQLMSLRCCPR